MSRGQWLVAACVGAVFAAAVGAQIGYMKLDPPPVLEKGRTLLPFRPVAEAFDAKVQFDPSTKRISARRGERTIELTLNRKQAKINGQPKQLSVAPKVIKGSTYLPLRAVAEALGIHVEYKPGTIKVCTAERCVLIKPPTK